MCLRGSQILVKTELHMVYAVTSEAVVMWAETDASFTPIWFPCFSSDMEFELWTSSIRGLKYSHTPKSILLKAAQGTKMRQ